MENSQKSHFFGGILGVCGGKWRILEGVSGFGFQVSGVSAET